MKTLPEITSEIDAWHWARFPWANAEDIVKKMASEYWEFHYAVTSGAPLDERRQMIADEGADVLIAALAIFARYKIDPMAAIESKFAEVVKKYPVERLGLE